MKIAAVEAYKLSIKYPEPITISFHSFAYSENFFIKLVAENGLVGWGEGAPFEPITGDSEHEVRQELPKLHCVVGADIFEYANAVMAMPFASPTLRAACDSALHDLAAKAKGIPVYKLYRHLPRKVPNSVTVFIKPTIEATIAEARRILSVYPELEVLKIKLQGSDDIARCAAIRSAVERPMQYVLDANQGYEDPERAVADLNSIVALLGDVLLIEEPCRKGELEKARFVRERVSRAKVIADESCCSLADLDAIINAKAFDGINIKLQKAGGIAASRSLAMRAQQAGLSVMVGQMFETPLSTAASLVVAATCDSVLLTDLDMDLDLPVFCSGKVPFSEGCRSPVETAGFGFGINTEEIQYLTSSSGWIFERWL